MSEDREDDQTALELVASQIKTVGEGVDESTVVDWARSAGVQLPSDEALRTRLPRACPTIRWSRRNEVYLWRDPDDAAAVSRSQDPLEQLVRWARSTDDTERGELERDLVRQIAAQRPDAPEVLLVQALGITDGPVDWSQVPADDSVPEALIERLAERAEPIWLVRASANHVNSSLRSRIKKLDDLDRSEAAARWLGGIQEPDDVPSGVTTQIGRVHKLAQQPTPAYVRALASLAARAAAWSDVDATAKNRAAGAVANAILDVEPDVARSAIDAEFVGADAVTAWLKCLAEADRPASVRAGLIRLVASTARSSALFTPAVWAGLGLDDIGEVVSSEEVQPLLDRGLASQLPAVVRAASPREFGTLVGAVAAFPVLEPFAPESLATTLLRREEPSARVARAAANPLIASAVDEVEQRAVDERARMRDELEALQGRLATAEEDAATARSEATATEDRLRHAHRSSASSSDAERRQARLDVLRAWIDSIEAIRNVAATLADRGLLDAQIREMERALTAFDVTVRGAPGEQVAFDPTVHESADAVAGDLVEVLTPAYLLADTATPLRYGLVRRQE